MASDETPDQVRSVSHRSERHHLERGDSQLLRTHGPDAFVRRGRHELHDTAQRRAKRPSLRRSSNARSC